MTMDSKEHKPTKGLVLVDYRLFLPEINKWTPWEIYGYVVPQKADELLAEKDKRYEYRVRRYLEYR